MPSVARAASHADRFPENKKWAGVSLQRAPTQNYLARSKLSLIGLVCNCITRSLTRTRTYRSVRPKVS